MPNAQLPAGTTPRSAGIDARIAFDRLCANGFPEDVIAYCSVSQADGTIKWASGDRRRCAMSLVLRRDSSLAALGPVADRLLSQHPTVCSVDRLWSELGNMFPAQRTRLAVAKADNMMLVRNCYRQRNNITANNDDVEKAFWISEVLDD